MLLEASRPLDINLKAFENLMEFIQIKSDISLIFNYIIKLILAIFKCIQPKKTIDHWFLDI